MDWLDEVFGFNVERREIKRSGGRPYFPISNTGVGVLHTTEGDTVDGAWSTLNGNFSAPHFITGENRIVQCRPLTAQGAALRANAPHNPNREAQIQIEMVARSSQSLWLPVDGTLQPTVALMAYCAQNLGIPLRIPVDWPDDCSDVPLPWAAENARRIKAADGLWPTETGWWMHMEVPWQQPSWHWDCGAVKRSVMIQMANDQQ
jgi:hypothetical protein